MRFVCWKTNAIETHSEYAIRIVSVGQKSYAKATQYYVKRTLPVG